MTPDDAAEMRRLCDLIDRGVAALREAASEYAHAENAYRHAKARAWTLAPTGTVSERGAWVDGETADARLGRDLAEGQKVAAVEALRSRRAQLSAWQTAMTAERAEAEFARTTPRSTP